MEFIPEFNRKLENAFRFTLHRYQEAVAEDLINQLGRGERFITVSMPTGSGKTILEMLAAEYLLSRGYKRILVLEPTRFLCDQMHPKWKLLVKTGKEYEGNCWSFLRNYKVVISTPQTALKCVSNLQGEFDAVIIDEVHHAITGKYYNELIPELRPKVVIGFTALLPSEKAYKASVSKIGKVVGELKLLHYDFQELSKIDSKFNPPKALVDIFDSELDERERKLYDLLYFGRLPGDAKTLYFLERTFSRYGKKAFCESFSRAVEKGNITVSQHAEEINGFCRGDEPSHKARALLDVLTVYNPEENPKLRPVIVFTSRKATAYEFKDAIVRGLKVPHHKVEVLTSDLSREQRKELLLRAKKGDVHLIISTLVGEEGVDIPEAGVLVMTDVPRSPLRFYQRLGRLIRVSSPMSTKVFVITMTPKTEEYGDLSEAVRNLYWEGVDVSYILLNLEEKLTIQRLLDYIRETTKMLNSKWASYMLLTQGDEPRDPVEYYLSALKSSETFERTLKQVFGELYREEFEEWAFLIVTKPILRAFSEELKKTMKNVEKRLNRGKVVRDFDRLIREDRLFYFYDPERLSDMVLMELERLRKESLENQASDSRSVLLWFDRKGFLRLFTNVFLIENLESIIEDMKEKIRENEEIFGDIYLETNHNKRSKAIVVKAYFSASASGIKIRIEPQFNYYNFNENSELKEKKIELIELNVKDICYRAMEKYLEKYGEINSNT
ncbi:DEAD/DEAH box helicase [Thermococcus camini]|uniref:DNA repair protein Rad25 n=1 Tax=Thermococcus camini TaxID=2016373 RepID=A0A7G2D5M1_9EURY|nr:DEAD/DEAH box helicase [Thermococcus camini]CAD5243288.1 DNA repair protein Rad25 [Thermococcus camini]